MPWQEALSLWIPVGLALELSPSAGAALPGGLQGCQGQGRLWPRAPARAGSLAGSREPPVTQLTRFVWDSIVPVGSFAVMDNQLGGNSAPGRGANK